MENKQIHNPTRSELITDFVKSNPEYYIKEFQKIGSKPSFSFSFNLYAGILGPIWFGMRNIWNWALAFLIIETFSVVQIIRGLFGNITKEAVEKIKQVESTIAFRNKQLEAAITNNPDKVDVYKRNIKSSTCHKLMRSPTYRIACNRHYFFMRRTEFLFLKEIFRENIIFVGLFRGANSDRP